MAKSLLFVCLGNICRSPLAEAAMRAEAERHGLELELDSAGTGDWHIGSPPDPRAIAVARRNGIDISGLRARQVRDGDFRRFDRILALDRDNLARLEEMRPRGAHARLGLLLDAVDGRAGEPVADPYYGGDAHFERTWADVCEAARAIAAELARRA